MDDRTDNRFRPLVIIIVVVVAAVAWLYFNRAGVTQAADETVDVFVPDAQAFERRTGPVNEARRLVDEINSR